MATMRARIDLATCLTSLTYGLTLRMCGSLVTPGQLDSVGVPSRRNMRSIWSSSPYKSKFSSANIHSAINSAINSAIITLPGISGFSVKSSAKIHSAINSAIITLPGMSGFSVRSSAKTAPSDQTSIAGPYVSQPKSSSGARYHSVTTMCVYGCGMGFGLSK